MKYGIAPLTPLMMPNRQTLLGTPSTLGPGIADRVWGQSKIFWSAIRGSTWTSHFVSFCILVCKRSTMAKISSAAPSYAPLRPPAAFTNAWPMSPERPAAADAEFRSRRTWPIAPNIGDDLACFLQPRWGAATSSAVAVGKPASTHGPADLY